MNIINAAATWSNSITARLTKAIYDNNEKNSRPLFESK
jgi:hypothetical protein